MPTLRCTGDLLERLGVPRDERSDARPDNALGDWHAKLVRAGRRELVVAMNDRSYLVLVMAARGVRHSLRGSLPATLAMLFRGLEVPSDIAEQEVLAMHPMAYARTADRSLVAALNERGELAGLLARDGRSPMEIMVSLAGMPMLTERVRPKRRQRLPALRVREGVKRPPTL